MINKLQKKIRFTLEMSQKTLSLYQFPNFLISDYRWSMNFFYLLLINLHDLKETFSFSTKNSIFAKSKNFNENLFTIKISKFICRNNQRWRKNWYQFLVANTKFSIKFFWKNEKILFFIFIFIHCINFRLVKSMF